MTRWPAVAIAFRSRECARRRRGDDHSVRDFFVSNYLFANIDACIRALLAVILSTGAAIPGVLVKEFALLLCMELGIMAVITLGGRGQPHLCRQR
jgi:hypothetical protein